MGMWDIRPYDLEGGRHRILHFLADPTTTGAVDTAAAQDTSFLEGNILSVDATVGDILVADDGAFDPSTGLHCLSAISSQGLITHGNLADPVAAAGPRMVPVYDMVTGAQFATALAYNNSDTELDLDTGFQIGDSFDLWVDDAVATAIGHNHGIDLNGDFFICTRKLDANGRDSIQTGLDTVEVVFKSNT